LALLTSIVKFGGRRVLVSQPNVHHYGHLGLEILMSLAMAKRIGASVFFVRPREVAGAGLFEIDSPEVPVLRPAAPVRGMLRARWVMTDVSEVVREWREDFSAELTREVEREMSPFIHGKTFVPEPMRDRLRGIRTAFHDWAARVEREAKARPSYFQRKLLRAPIAVKLRPEAEAQAAAQAAAFGIAPDAKLVCIHNREPGYKKGLEIQDRKPEAGRDDRVRNGRIESYFDACDELVARGYTIIRLGDPTMTPVSRPGIVDLATSPNRTNLLEIYCLLRSDMLIAGESGLWGVGLLTNTPMLLVNVTEPVAAYPLRAPGLFLPKTIVDRVNGKTLSNMDQLGYPYHRHLRNQRRYIYLDSPPDKIAAAALEMLDYISGSWVESPAQREYHEAIIAANDDLRARIMYVRKWGGDGDFLGDGRIAKAATL
jgi:putative glycosyltransferase (TIGR04372 family)